MIYRHFVYSNLVVMELCWCVLDSRIMHDEWKTSVIEPIFKEKCNVISCGSYRELKLLEHVMKIVERLLEWQIRTLVNLNKIQFGLMSGK